MESMRQASPQHVVQRSPTSQQRQDAEWLVGRGADSEHAVDGTVLPGLVEFFSGTGETRK